jgi:AcrR family transcriptional regulator
MTTRTRTDRRQAMAGQTRRDILQTARRLFARQGYAATSVTDIASEAGVAVQTIYARLGSKRGMLMALIDLIDEEADAGALAAGVRAAGLPADALAAEVRLTRVFQERCGDIIGALFAAAAVEPDLAAAVAEGQRRHRDGARLAVARITELGGLRENLAPERAAALIAIATTHEAWRELRHAYGLSWDDAETLLCDTLGRAVLTTSPAPPRRRSQRKTAAAAGRPAPARLPTPAAGTAVSSRIVRFSGASRRGAASVSQARAHLRAVADSSSLLSGHSRSRDDSDTRCHRSPAPAPGPSACRYQQSSRAKIIMKTGSSSPRYSRDRA